MNVTLPFKPVKGQAFTYVGSANIVSATAENYSASPTVYISKDGGALNSTANSPTAVYEGSPSYVGYFTLALTSSEMDADFVVVVLRGLAYSGWGENQTIIIYTIPAELSAAPTVNSSIEEKITALWQYFFFKRTITASAEALFKDDGTTPLASNTLTDDGTTVTKGEIS